MTERIAVLYFTDGPESDASRRSALDVMGAISSSRADLVPLTETNWQKTLKPFPTETLFFLCTHGGIGENGTLQAWLEDRGSPHTHSSARVCSVLLDKHRTKLTY